MIGREEVINTLIKRIELRESTHVQAKNGSGKTTLLQYLESQELGLIAEARPMKQLILALSGEEKGTINELKKKVKPNETTLLLDDVHNITKTIKQYVKKLLNHGLVLVTAGEHNEFNLETIKLKPLSKTESLQLVKKYVKNTALARVIVEELDGNPARLMNAVRKARARQDLKTIKGFKSFKESINNLLPRKELISVSLLALLYPITQSIRHLMYAQRNYKMGHYAALTAYILMLLKNLRKR